MDAAIREFWDGYLNSLNKNVRRQEQPNDIFAFGDSPKLANELATLVKQGVKTATASALRSYESEQKSLPQKGDLSIVLDGIGVPVCVIETSAVFVTPFNEVTKRFAYEEGEETDRLRTGEKLTRSSLVVTFPSTLALTTGCSSSVNGSRWSMSRRSNARRVSTPTPSGLRRRSERCGFGRGNWVQLPDHH
jgi:uncharacterized protein YhfF